MQEPHRPNAARLNWRALWCLPLMAALSTPLAAQVVNYATPYTFTFLAGSPALAGSSDGTGTGASFDQPNGIALDSSGNLYVADKKNNTIRKVTAAGVVTTLAGSPGVSGTTDGTGSAALFNQPIGIALDKSGNLYVTDSGNATIRKVTTAGVVTTVAGAAGSAGSTNGTGTAASFSSPYGIAVDSNGNIYVSELGNNDIREVTSAGVVTNYAAAAGAAGSSDGTGTAASFDQPAALAIDSNANLYVADSGNATIRKVATGGVVTTLAGSPGVTGYADGTGLAARFKSPRGIAVDGSGNLFVSDSENGTIRKIGAGTVVTTIAGAPGAFSNSPGTGASALFDVPLGIAVTSNGTVYVASELGYVIYQGAAATAVSPAFTLEPSGQAIASGSTVVFNVLANGVPAPTYQWEVNGVALANGAGASGATSSTLVLSGATAAEAGNYTCTITNASGSVASTPAVLSVSTTTDVGRLINVSCLSEVGTAGSILIPGFAIGGAGTSGPMNVLVRASGPALGLPPFDIAGVLPDPALTLFSGPDVIGSDVGWDGSATIATAAMDFGAFPWNASSADSAIVTTLAEGPYTAQISGRSGDTGLALAEVYDATTPGAYTPSSPRLTNISARAQAGTGGNILVAGFVIGGSTARTVLIRASGPALAAAPFSLTGTLPDPELQLYESNGDGTSTLLGENDGWGGNPQVASAAASVGAFPWSASSADSAFLVTLAPGAYTAQVLGASNDSGLALIEVYEVP